MCGQSAWTVRLIAKVSNSACRQQLAMVHPGIRQNRCKGCMQSDPSGWIPAVSHLLGPSGAMGLENANPSYVLCFKRSTVRSGQNHS